MKIINYKNYFIIIILFFLSSFSISNANQSDGIDVKLRVGSCNNNGICEEGSEDFFVCPLDCTPIVVSPDAKSGSSVVGSLVIDNLFNDLTVEVSYTSAVIRWKSFIPTMSNIKWGTNPDYKDGVIKNVNFLLDHKIELNNLKEGTLYYFNLEAETLLGKTSSMENQVFRTLSHPDDMPPGNPTNVSAVSSKNGIVVSWQNPKDEDFDYVRVMRNEDRHYSSPFVGKLVYEGNGSYFIDGKVKLNHKYYYTLFARDRSGNYSSGSLVNIIYELSFPVVEKGDSPIIPSDKKFIVLQDSSSYDFKFGDIVYLNGDVPFIIKTNHPSLGVDDMWVEIRDKDKNILNQYFFFRKKDSDGFVHINMPAFEKAGYYHVSFYKYDGKNTIVINKGAFNVSKVDSIYPKKRESAWISLFIVIILLLLLILIILLYKTIKKYIERKQKQK